MDRRTALRSLAGLVAMMGSALTATSRVDVFARQNLLAWSFIPFDSAHRGPIERAEMLHRLGITKLAYDGRPSDFLNFSQDLAALRTHNITLQAVWLNTGLTPKTDPHVSLVFDTLKKNNVATQLWWPVSTPKEFDSLPEETQFEQATRAMNYLAERARSVNCSLGLYGNGSWGGDPEHQLSLVKRVKRHDVGIVYNFEHAYDHLDRFSSVYPRLVPHLMATNLSGIRKGNPELLAIGQGDMEFSMLKTVRDSGFHGPIGIISTDRKGDAETSLKMNLEGLKKLLQQMGDTEALRTY